MASPLSRRSFLKAGIVGTIALVAAGSLYRMLKPPEALHSFVLDDTAQTILAAIVASMLENAARPGSSDIQKAIASVQDAIAGLPLATQKEIKDLFALLALGPTRRFLAGVPDDWVNVKPDDITAFLQSWRLHRIGMLQSAYHALHDLITGSWYADESNWASIGYPGPIKELS